MEWVEGSIVLYLSENSKAVIQAHSPWVHLRALSLVSSSLKIGKLLIHL